MKFHIASERDKYVIRDENGTVYGSYSKKKEAEESAQLWAEYYGLKNSVCVGVNCDNFGEGD